MSFIDKHPKLILSVLLLAALGMVYSYYSTAPKKPKTYYQVSESYPTIQFRGRIGELNKVLEADSEGNATKVRLYFSFASFGDFETSYLTQVAEPVVEQAPPPQ